MADAEAAPIVTEPVAEAAPAQDGAAEVADPEPAVPKEAAGTKRKFEEAADGPDAGEDEHLHKRVASEPEAATTSAEADATAAGQSVSTEPTTTDAVEAAPAGAPEAEAAGAPETAAALEAEPAPVANGDASTEAAEAPRQSGFDVQPTAEQAAAQAADGGPDEAAVQAAQAQAAATASALTQTAGALEQMVQVPGSMVGKLIGKQGETIKGLQYSTNTRIQIDHTTPGDLKHVTVTGTAPEQVASAVAQINNLMSEASGPGAGDVSETVECPPGIVGRIIGRGGETIRGLQQASGAHIVVNQDFPEGVPRQVSITGKPDSVQRAVSMVQELIQGEPGSAQAIIQKRTLQFGAGVSRVLECPKGMVGRVIGKGGETIKALQKQFASNIQIDQSSDPMTITIAGQPHTVDSCAQAVQEIIAGGNPFGANAPPNFAGDGGAFAGAYGQQGGYGAPAYGGGYGGGFPPQPYAQPGYGSPYGAAPYGAGYGAPAPAYGGYGGFPGGADPYATQQGSYGAQPDYGAPAAAPAAAAGVWQELPDPEGRPYYYNTQTGVSQWEKPAEMA